MIVYDVICPSGHCFEGWFASGAAFDEQRAAGEIACPVCASTKVDKALMAPNVGPKSNKSSESSKGAAQAPAAETPDNKLATGEAMQMLARLRRAVEENCDYVGGKFAEEARKIHYGETDARSIYGEASKDEAIELHDEGIDFARIPWLPRGEN